MVVARSVVPSSRAVHRPPHQPAHQPDRPVPGRSADQGLGVQLLPAAAGRFVRAHHHVASRAELRTLGLSDAAVDRLLQAPGVTTPLRGVLAFVDPTGAGHGAAAHARAACLASRHAVASHRTAAALWELPVGAGRALHVTVPARVHLSLRPYRVHRSTVLGGAHVVHRSDGIRVTSLARTVVDLGALLTDDQLAALVAAVVAGGRCTPAELLDAWVPLRHRGRPGARRVERTLVRLGVAARARMAA